MSAKASRWDPPPLPPGLTPPAPATFTWCGGCGCPTRPMADEEATEILRWALEVGGVNGLRAIADVAEEVTRGYCDHGAPRLADVPDRGYFVYRLYDDTDRVLYVGMSRRLRGRLAEHYRTRGGYVVRHEFEELPTEGEMVARERELIRSLHPPLNDIDNGEG